MRVFLDTNVLASAFTARGLCADLYELVALEHELIVGGPVATELLRVLEKKLKVPSARLSRVKEQLDQFEQAPTQPIPPDTLVDDAADAAVLGSAIGGRADIIVTGDKALQDLGSVAGIPVVSPRTCWMGLVAQDHQ